jgi:metal-responsive CopG/Arc/MetJ family transcriptional regulator
VATTKVEIDKALWAKVQEHTATAGYSSPEEFLQHLIEKELAKSADPDSNEAAARKIRGVGYIDAGLDI